MQHCLEADGGGGKGGDEEWRRRVNVAQIWWGGARGWKIQTAEEGMRGLIYSNLSDGVGGGEEAEKDENDDDGRDITQVALTTVG
jgi:hypothetical protein